MIAVCLSFFCELFLNEFILFFHLRYLNSAFVVVGIFDGDEEVLAEVKLVDLHRHLKVQLAESIERRRVEFHRNELAFLKINRRTVLEI